MVYDNNNDNNIHCIAGHLDFWLIAPWVTSLVLMMRMMIKTMVMMMIIMIDDDRGNVVDSISIIENHTPHYRFRAYFIYFGSSPCSQRPLLVKCHIPVFLIYSY